jgi:hypothetical protein
MTLLLLLAGGGTTVITPIGFGTAMSILMPDEVPVGQQVDVYAHAFDSSGLVAFDAASQLFVWGFSALGVRSPMQPPCTMTQIGDLWTCAWTPTTAGTYEVAVAAVISGVDYVVTRALTVRPQFDPIGLAVDEVLVSRMGNDDVLGTV